MSKTLIALGVTGGIAAYKSAQLCSDLVKAGFEVQVIMTENAVKFVTPLTFRTLSRNPVITSLWELPQWQPEHVALAQSAELFITAPATVNFIAKYANGIADDALSTFYAAYNGKTLLAPAMNPQMWAHEACVNNVRILRERGVAFAGPASGHVACGADGTGRMCEVSEIYAAITALLEKN